MNDTPPEQPENPSQPPQQPTHDQGAAPPPGHQPPPQFVPPGGGQQPPPPPGGYPPYGYHPQYQPLPKKPTNTYAMGGLIVSGASLGLLIFTAGILAPLTLIGSIVGTVLGHKGKTDFDQGKAVQQRDEGLAGFWMGIAGIILAVLAIAIWVAVIIVIASSDIDWNDSNGMSDFQHHWEQYSW